MAVLCLRYSRTHKPDFENNRIDVTTDADKGSSVYMASALVLTMEIIKLQPNLILKTTVLISRINYTSIVRPVINVLVNMNTLVKLDIK